MDFNSQMSLYIPRVSNTCFMKQSGISFTNITDFTRHMFHSLDIGHVQRVDLVPIYSKNGSQSNFSKAFVHFDAWYNTSCAQSVQEKIHDPATGGIAKLVYDDPHYWILKQNTSNARNNHNEITDLKSQISEMTTRLETYHTMLSYAQHQLGSLQGLITSDHTNGMDPRPGPVKRRRASPLESSTPI
jgi:hypothetical protein